MLAASISALALVAAATRLEQLDARRIAEELSQQELTIAQSARGYLAAVALPGANGGVILNGTVIPNGSDGTIPITALAQSGLPPGLSGPLLNGGRSTVVVRAENGGAVILVADSLPLPVASASAYLRQSGMLGKGVSNGGLYALGGAFQGALGNYGLAAPPPARFIPLAVAWVPATRISSN